MKSNNLLSFISPIYIIFFSLIFISCEKENTYNNVIDNESESITVNAKSESRVLTDQQIKQIGELHNQFLEEAFLDFDYNSENTFSELEHQFNNIVTEQNIEVMLSSYETDISSILNTLEQNLSSDAYKILVEVKNKAENITDVNSFSSEVMHYENLARVTLNGKELDIILTGLSVFKSSAYFWLPANKGGSGIGDNFLKSNNPNYDFSNTQARGWLVADGLSASGGCLGVAVGAALATNPVGWGVFVGVACAAAFVSGVNTLL